MKKGFKYIIIIFFIFVGLILILKVNTLFEGDKGRIKRIIYAAKRATEREDLFKCISYISNNYTDKYGNDRRSLLLVAKQVFDIYDDIIIGIRELDISVDRTTAKAEVVATGIARNIERKETSIFETETIKFLILFKKEGEGWKVVKLEFLEPRDVLGLGIS